MLSELRLKRTGLSIVGGRGVMVAHQAFTLAGEGSNPSDPKLRLRRNHKN